MVSRSERKEKEKRFEPYAILIVIILAISIILSLIIYGEFFSIIVAWGGIIGVIIMMIALIRELMRKKKE